MTMDRWRNRDPVLILHSGVEVSPWSVAAERLVANNWWEKFDQDTVLPNPAFLEAKRVGRWTGNIPKTIALRRYDRSTDTMVLPLGYADRLARMLAGQEGATPRTTVPLIDARVSVPAPPVESKIVLRPYQEDAVRDVLEALESVGYALLVSPPGSGKTEMALAVVAGLRQRTLWITHTMDLARQAIDRAKSRLSLQDDDIGIIGASQFTFGRVLTVGLVQTLCKLPPALLREKFGLVVVDEVHHSPAVTWSSVLDNLAARYRLGVTGSLERQDGLEHITMMYFGPVTHEVPDDALEGSIIRPELRVLGTDCIPESWRRFQEAEERYQQELALWQRGIVKSPKRPIMPFGDILDELLNDPERNALILQLLERICPGRKTLVLSKTVSHCELLAEALRERMPGLRIEVIHGKQSAKVRQDIIMRARAGEVDVLFSVNVAKEGLDVPCLDQLVFVAGGKDRVYITQAIGRIQRPHPGKTQATVWDVVDWKVGAMKAQHWKRRAIYRELGLIVHSAKRRVG